MIHIIKAGREHLEDLTVLFDQYRMFYGQSSDRKAGRNFLSNRLELEQSVIFMAVSEKEAVGFTQLYPSYSSVSMKSLYILNDLFVVPGARQQGIGKGLLRRAQAFCNEMNSKGLVLETATDNPARRLYESLGWKRDSHFLHYFWTAEPH